MLNSKQIPIEFSGNPTKYKKLFKIKVQKAKKFILAKGGMTAVSQKIEYVPVKRVVTVLKIIKPALKRISRKARIKLTLKPTEILTRKPKDIRMGRGKGAPTDRVGVAGATDLLSIHQSPSSYLSKKLLRKTLPKYHKLRIIKTDKW